MLIGQERSFEGQETLCQGSFGIIQRILILLMALSYHTHINRGISPLLFLHLACVCESVCVFMKHFSNHSNSIIATLPESLRELSYILIYHPLEDTWTGTEMLSPHLILPDFSFCNTQLPNLLFTEGHTLQYIHLYIHTYNHSMHIILTYAVHPMKVNVILQADESGTIQCTDYVKANKTHVQQNISFTKECIV